MAKSKLVFPIGRSLAVGSLVAIAGLSACDEAISNPAPTELYDATAPDQGGDATVDGSISNPVPPDLGDNTNDAGTSDASDADPTDASTDGG